MQRFFVLNFGIQLLLIGVVILVSSYNSLFASISIGKCWLILKLIIFKILWRLWFLDDEVDFQSLRSFPFLSFLFLLSLLLLLLFFLDEAPQFAKEFDAEECQKDGDENIGNDGRQNVVENGSNGGPVKHIGDNDHDYIVVYKGCLLLGVSSEHQREEIVEGCACYKRITYDCCLCFWIVESQHE